MNGFCCAERERQGGAHTVDCCRLRFRFTSAISSRTSFSCLSYLCGYDNETGGFSKDGGRGGERWGECALLKCHVRESGKRNVTCPAGSLLGFIFCFFFLIFFKMVPIKEGRDPSRCVVDERRPPNHPTTTTSPTTENTLTS